MITYVQGDLFTSPAQVLGNTVNTVGVMGKGIAKQFKHIYPDMFDEYQWRCERGQFDVGQLMLYRTMHKWILNFPTKRHWRSPSRVEYIEAGLKAFRAHYAMYGIHSAAFPQLGCGNGELDWETQVRPLMERYLGDLPIDLFVHMYDNGRNSPEHRVPADVRHWLRSEPKSLAFAEFWDDLKDLVRQSRMESWRIVPVEDGEALICRARDEQTTIAKDDVLELWQKLRAFGYLTRSDLPAVCQRIAPALFALLASLQYIELIQIIVAKEGTRTEPVGKLLAVESNQGVKLIIPSLVDTPSLIQPDLFSLNSAE